MSVPRSSRDHRLLEVLLLAAAAMPAVSLAQPTFTQLLPASLVVDACPAKTLNQEKPYALGWSLFPPSTCSCPAGVDLPTHQSYTSGVQSGVDGLEVLGQFLVHGTGPAGSSRFLAFVHVTPVPRAPCLLRSFEYGLSVDLSTRTMSVFQCTNCAAGEATFPGRYASTVVYGSPQDLRRYRLHVDAASDLVFTMLGTNGVPIGMPQMVARAPFMPGFRDQTGILSIMSRQDAPGAFAKSAFFADEFLVGN